jgi:hypothetical protein
MERVEKGSWLNHLVGDWFCVTDKDNLLIRAFNARTNENLPLRADITSIYAADSDENRSIVAVGFDDAAAYKRGQYGVIDNKTGETLIDCQFDRLMPIGENYFALAGNTGGLVDKNGEWIVQTPLFGNSD